MTIEQDRIQSLILDRLTQIDSRMNRMEERMDDEKDAASESRRRIYDRLEQQGSTLITVSHRMEGLEKAVAADSVTLSDFRETRAKAAAAGWVGGWLWRTGKYVLGAAAALYAMRQDVAAWWHWFIGR
ncbi:hypothetical protein M2360_000948 [Rhizobium sp. SG_E_25_P2]|uniref:hypothetical protein n=1 Tax=Rhizobium sp. SG_E_25_P2 TaxID=2879942 RepID=UPI0024766C0A|nr:hypothetical protein [Rhizobium sp. SG_E_25_P2]MDH6265558.1 hypothetical protein [Rhizobium sp. SG_E_25_P2]